MYISHTNYINSLFGEGLIQHLIWGKKNVSQMTRCCFLKGFGPLGEKENGGFDDRYIILFGYV